MAVLMGALERDLFFVPKKGRPATQCPHCRLERKRRSAHVKCDCGDKAHSKDKCPHLGDVAEHSYGELDPVPESHDPDNASCCCHHGGKCNCATLKSEGGHEPIDTTSAHYIARSKPRLMTTQSDGHLANFTVGHPTPLHRHNYAAHESGLPYKMPRSQTLHSMSVGNRRSVDSLAQIQRNKSFQWSQQQVSTVPTGQADFSASLSPGPSPDHGYPTAFAMPMQPAPSQCHTPSPSHSVTPIIPQPVAFQGFDFDLPQVSNSVDSTIEPWSMPSSTFDANMSVADATWNTVDWSTWAGTVDNAQPALTNTSSGTMSEIDELPLQDDSISAPTHTFIQDAQTFCSPPRRDIAVTLPTAYNTVPHYGIPQPSRWSLPASFMGNAAQNPFAMTGYDNTSTDKIFAFSPMEMGSTPSDPFTTCFANTMPASTMPTTSTPEMPHQSATQPFQSLGHHVDWESLLDPYQQSGGSSWPFPEVSDRPVNIASSTISTHASSRNNSAIGTPGVSAMFEQAYMATNNVKCFPASGNGSVSTINQDYINAFGYDNNFSPAGLNEGWAT